MKKTIKSQIVIDLPDILKYFKIQEKILDYGKLMDFGFDDELGDYGKDFEKINEKLENIHFALKLLCFNLDYRKYAKFLHLTPHLYRGKEIYGKYITYWDFTKETDFTEEKVEFCINFIIESALKLQELNFFKTYLKENLVKIHSN